MKIKFLTMGAPIVMTLVGAWLVLSPPLRVGYAPDQPYAYNHQLHAGKYEIDCQYCHTGVAVSKKAGVPSLSVCMNCHQAVGYGIEAVTKLKADYKAGKDPEWVKIHNAPDHVRFAHGPHVKALLKEGEPTKAACMQCHGDIANMKVVAQVEPHNMGWCVNCHRDYRDNVKYIDHGVDISCSTCHY